MFKTKTPLSLVRWGQERLLLGVLGGAAAAQEAAAGGQGGQQQNHQHGDEDTLTSKLMIGHFWEHPVVKLRQGSGKDRQGMALKAKGLKA